MTSPFGSDVHSGLSYQIGEISAILASGSPRMAEILFDRYRALPEGVRPEFVAALIGELLVERAQREARR